MTRRQDGPFIRAVWFAIAIICMLWVMAMIAAGAMLVPVGH